MLLRERGAHCFRDVLFQGDHACERAASRGNGEQLELPVRQFRDHVPDMFDGGRVLYGKHDDVEVRRRMGVLEELVEREQEGTETSELADLVLHALLLLRKSLRPVKVLVDRLEQDGEDGTGFDVARPDRELREIGEQIVDPAAQIFQEEPFEQDPLPLIVQKGADPVLADLLDGRRFALSLDLQDPHALEQGTPRPAAGLWALRSRPWPFWLSWRHPRGRSLAYAGATS